MISNIDNLGNELTQEQIKFFENTKVKNDKDELLVCYHGTTSNFSSFKEPINWFSTDRVYSSQYSLGTSGLMSVYLNCLNMFDCGNTGIPVFDLLPIKPYRFSSAFSKIIERLGLSEDQARELIKQVVDERDKGLYIPIEYTKDMYEYKLRAHIVTRTDAFKRLISSKGYDSIRTVEDGAVCFGVFNSNAIKSINNKKPTSSSDINEELKMDRIKDSGLEDIIGYINKLCYTYDEDGNETPSYCFLHDITDEFGLTDDEALSIAREGGFKEMKVVPNRMVDGTILIAAKETTPDIVQNDYEKFYDVDVEVLDRSKDDDNNNIKEAYNNLGFPEKSNLKKILDRFNSNGRYAKQGKWSIGGGGYDLAFVIYYDESPIIQGFIETGYTEIVPVYGSYSDILDMDSIIKFVCDVYKDCKPIKETYNDVVEESIDIKEKASPDGYAPTKTGKAYKVFKVKNGKLYPPMVANKGGEDTPIGIWLDAEEGEFAGLSKTGRPQVKSTGSGNLSYRPGWHLGDVPRAPQFDRRNKETGEMEFPKDFVWAECDYAMDVDYQSESDARGYERTKVDDQGNVITTKSKKFQHSLAGLPKLPTNGYYKYRTNPRPDTVPWVITGQMKVNRLLDDFEVNEILKSKGIEPIHRQGGDKTLKELGLTESLEEKCCNEDIEKHDTLNPKLWDENNQLKPEVHEKILQIVDEFKSMLAEDGIKIDIKDIILVGSNASYNYTKDSDLDIHIKVDLDNLECPSDLYPLLYSAYRSIFNKNLDIDFYGIPVEIFVETV